MEPQKSKYQLRPRTAKSKSAYGCCEGSSNHDDALSQYRRTREKRKLKVDLDEFQNSSDESDHAVTSGATFTGVLNEDVEIIFGTPSPPVLRSKRRRKIPCTQTIASNTDASISTSTLNSNDACQEFPRGRYSKARTRSKPRCVMEDPEHENHFGCGFRNRTVPFDSDVIVLSDSPELAHSAQFFHGASVSESNVQTRNKNSKNNVLAVDDSDSNDDSDSDDDSAGRFMFRTPTWRVLSRRPVHDDAPAASMTKAKKQSSNVLSASISSSHSVNGSTSGIEAHFAFDVTGAATTRNVNDEIDGPATGNLHNTARSRPTPDPFQNNSALVRALVSYQPNRNVARLHANGSTSDTDEIQDRPSATVTQANLDLSESSMLSSPERSSNGGISFGIVSPLAPVRLPNRLRPTFSSTPTAATPEVDIIRRTSHTITAPPSPEDIDSDVIYIGLTDSSDTDVSLSVTPRRNPVVSNLARQESPSTVSPATMRNIEMIDQISADEAFARELQEQFNEETQHVAAAAPTRPTTVTVRETQPNAAAASTLTTTVTVGARSTENPAEDNRHPGASPVRSALYRRSEERRQRVRNLVAQSEQMLSQMNQRLGQMNTTLQTVGQNTTRPRVSRTTSRTRRTSRDTSRLPSELRRELENLDRQLQAIIQRRQMAQTRSNSRTRGAIYRRGSGVFDHSFGPNNYEELLALSERMGPARPRGLTKTQLQQLPTFAFTSDGDKEDNTCNICFIDYEKSEMLRRLPCFHRYHAECIDPWIKDNPTCPICRVEVKL